MRKLTVISVLTTCALLGLGFWFLVHSSRDGTKQTEATSFGSSKSPESVQAAPQTASAIQASATVIQPASSVGTDDIEARLDREPNYRVLVHAMLANGDRKSALTAMKALNRCSGFPLNNKVFLPQKIALLNQRVRQFWEARSTACDASGGIDGQQRRAVGALIKDRYPELLYLNNPMNASEAERAVIDTLSSPYAAFSWIDKKIERGDVKLLLASGRPVPNELASLAVQAEALSMSLSESLYGMVTLCATQKYCEDETIGEQVDKLVRSQKKISEADWTLVRKQARAELKRSFPTLMARSNS